METKETKITLSEKDFRVGQKVFCEIKTYGNPKIGKIVEFNFSQGYDYVSIEFENNELMGNEFCVTEIKPILRRLDSMTKEENKTCINYDFGIYIDWLDANNFDRPRLFIIDSKPIKIDSLIDAGLAVDEATLEGDAK